MTERYGQFCPVSLATEVFGRRWTPLLLRELMCGSTRFSELQRGVPLMARSLLARRLKEMEQDGLIEIGKRADGRGSVYKLTPAGEAFRPIVELLGQWGQQWGRGHADPQNLDASLLMIAISRQVPMDRLPSRRITIEFQFRGLPKGKTAQKAFWLVLDPTTVDMCRTPPGFATDFTLRADLATFTRVYLGHAKLSAAIEAKRIGFEGPDSIRKLLIGYLGLADHARPVEYRLPAPGIAAALPS
jgi:DNA-binding HxlR family transcriptional regulator